MSLRALLFGHTFRVIVRFNSGQVVARNVRVRGLTMHHAWLKLLEAPSHPDVGMRTVAPLGWRP